MLSFIFVRLPLCNKYIYDIYDIYLYAHSYYMCCLLWRIYDMHPTLFLKSGCDNLLDRMSSLIVPISTWFVLAKFSGVFVQRCHS
jgi:hypothetical protein